ncbi:FIST domain-containing signal transduction protein [Oleiphilus messinensis]|uniref:FIST domain-containing signal transduction protein n=1 Tax=Oleiphilus messinensis TaxID=141451 RepID=A0A1Y0I9J9_9GAMM|nr:FIST N-terminal domain-containing protein [Oleiphilus messinensis]ARU57202.1 FIST domain-containing signal transduction protein [Oleiphilus messinensis]
MKSLSVSTQIPDPYRAGLELGYALKPIKPEVVFLFCTIHYTENNEILTGILDALEQEDTIIFGNSGDGFYETKGASELGAATLGINSEGKVAWHITSANGLETEPENCTTTAISNLKAKFNNTEPDLCWIAADFRTDASRIEATLQTALKAPVVGGMAADDNRMSDCALFKNDEILRNAVVLLGAQGDFSYDIIIANTLSGVGQPGTINSAHGTHINTIDNIDAMSFIERETGKPVLQSDRGVTSLTVIDEDQPEIKRIRSIVPDLSAAEGSLGLYGGIETGKRVQVCLATPEQMLNEVRQKCLASSTHALDPKAGIIISCAGRKWLLGEQIQDEIKPVNEKFGAGFPIAGFPSFGEIGPIKTGSGYSRPLFHNMTYVLVLIG